MLVAGLDAGLLDCIAEALGAERCTMIYCEGTLAVLKHMGARGSRRAGDVLIVDLSATRWAGIALVETLLDQLRPPAIVLIGSADSEVDQAARRLGVGAVVAKPVEPSLLRAALGRR